MKANVTIKDLARELDISPSTVSRALKDHPDISPETKKQVQELAERMHYRPNLVAQGLRKSKTNTIGVIIPEMIHFFFSTVISGIEKVAYARGYNVILSQSDENYEREVINTRALWNSRVDGMLVALSKQTKQFDHFQELLNDELPMVFFDRVTDQLNTSQVTVDDYLGAYKGVELLINKGCKNIVHLAGPDSLEISINRQKGYRDALESKNIAIRDEFIVKCTSGTYEEGKEKMLEIIEKHPEVDGVFGVNDMAALGSILALQEKGFNVPEQVKVMGFSNWQLSALIKPQLSTVSQPGFEIGEAAANILIDEIEYQGEEKEKVNKVISTTVIERETT
ncbi:MAG: LacI family DNA-binding transcriptional regulator [Bacteroidota bacterium]